MCNVKYISSWKMNYYATGIYCVGLFFVGIMGVRLIDHRPQSSQLSSRSLLLRNLDIAVHCLLFDLSSFSLATRYQ